MKKRDLFIITALAAFVMLFRLWAGSLSSWDEAYYAHISRGLSNAVDWKGFIWGEAAFLDKPLLYMWATALFYKLLGVSEFTTRLFSALCGIGTVVMIYVFSSRVFSRRAGIIAALMLMSTYHFVWFSKMGTLDVSFTLFLLLSIYFFHKAGTEPVNMLWSALWFTLAFLTKGVGAFLMPMIAGVYILARRRWDMIANRYTVLGALLFLAVGGGWYYARYLMHGGEVLRDGFFHHLVRRTTGTLDGHQGGPLSYVNAVLYKGKPWGAIGLAALPFFFYRTVKQKWEEGYLLLSWVCVTFLLFTAVKTKLHWYIMPVYPALIMIGAWGADRLLRKYSVAVVAAASLASVLYFGMEKDIFTLDYNPEVKDFAVTVSGLSGGDEVYVYGLGDPGARFYFGGFARRVGTRPELEGISRQSGAVIVSEPATIEDLGAEGRVIRSERSSYAAVKVE